MGRNKGKKQAGQVAGETSNYDKALTVVVKKEEDKDEENGKKTSIDAKKSLLQEDELIKRDNYIENITTIMSESDRKIKEIDSKQIFQSDDEIGWFFSGIKEIQELINEYNINK